MPTQENELHFLFFSTHINEYTFFFLILPTLNGTGWNGHTLVQKLFTGITYSYSRLSFP